MSLTVATDPQVHKQTSEDFNNLSTTQLEDYKQSEPVLKHAELDLDEKRHFPGEEYLKTPVKQIRGKRARSYSPELSEDSDAEEFTSPEIKVGSAVVYMLSKSDTAPTIVKKFLNDKL